MAVLAPALFVIGLTVLLVSSFTTISETWPRSRYLAFHYSGVVLFIGGAMMALLVFAYAGSEASL